MNWTCNYSLYNTIVLSRVRNVGRGAFSNVNAVRNVGHGAFGNTNAVRNVGRGAFGNTNAGWNTRKQTVLVEFEL